MAGFDEKCPYCDKVMNIRNRWDYESTFRLDCEHCQKTVSITVHSVPEFETSKLLCVRCEATVIEDGHYCKICQERIAKIKSDNDAYLEDVAKGE